MRELSRERLPEQAAREMESMIKDGTVLPGKSFPSERALAEEFKVSRLVIREAIRILEAKGLVYTRPGIGTLVSCFPYAREPHDILERLLDKDRLDFDVVDELLLFRRNLEIALVKLTAKRITADGIQKLQDDLKTFEEGILSADADEISAADESFHRRIAEISGSTILLRVVMVVWEALLVYQRFYFNNCEKPEVILKGLKEVLMLLEAHEAGAAGEAMERLLEYGDAEFIARMAKTMSNEEG
jgi:GntR family transcriptional repressor for pyruvate dehydrogenase complex